MTSIETSCATTENHGPSPQDDTEGIARTLGWLLLACGVLGAGAALVLSIEKIALLSDASYVPSCSLNPVLNCGSIMRTEQAEVFGFPNPLIGLAAFPVLAATGAGLLAGARYRRWYWIGLQAGVTFGAVFAAWLVFQSLYRINALCPYCMVVWAVVVPTFWAVTAANVARGTFGTRVGDSRLGRALVCHLPVLIAITGVTLAALITQRFWVYWSSLVT